MCVVLTGAGETECTCLHPSEEQVRFVKYDITVEVLTQPFGCGPPLEHVWA